MLEDHKNVLREEREEKKAAAKAALLEEQSMLGFMERSCEWMTPATAVWDGLESLMKPVPEEDTLTLEDINCWEVEDAVMHLEGDNWEFLHGEDSNDDGCNDFCWNDEDCCLEQQQDFSDDEAIGDANSDEKLCDTDGSPSDTVGFDPLFE